MNTTGPGKIILRSDGSPIRMHLDLSSILMKREMEQKGKQIYRVSRSNSKSPATTGGHVTTIHTKAKLAYRLSTI